MSSSLWQQFLTKQGAQFDTQQWADFKTEPNPAAIYDLSSLGLIAVSGEDAYPFLQGQFTNDIKQLSSGAQLTGYCTAKGRLLAIFYAFSYQETIYLQCPRTLLESLIKRLRMYVLRSKVTISDASDHFVSLGLVANDLNSIGTSAHVHGLTAQPYGTCIRLPDSQGLQRAQLLIHDDQAQAVWNTLCSQFTPGNTSDWERYEIQAGMPQVYGNTQDQFVPQMVNLDVLDGINFKKGCYTGQEIVARTHYLGKVKRRMLLANMPDSGVVPQAGDKIMDAQQQEAGQLVRVAPGLQNDWQLLVECRLEAYAAGTIEWQHTQLTFQNLPYLLAEQSS